MRLTWLPFLLLAPSGLIADEGQGFFEDYVLPMLSRNCFECHSHDAGKAKGGLVLDSRRGWEVGGDSGPAVVPGDPEASLLFKAVRYDHDDLQMPPKRKLADEDIQHVRQWIVAGAFDPRKSAVAIEAAPTAISADELWSFQPLTKPESPHDSIDDFVREKLNQRGLKLNAPASSQQMLRRLHYVLTGLPPEPDADIGNVEATVEELLESPHFGERWARHWLDVARYGESNGKAWNMSLPYSWRYRDWVIAAFNEDKPWDEFLVEQIAGDLLPADSTEQRNRQRIATGFLAIGSKTFWREKEEIPREEVEWVDEQLDVLGKAALGLSIGCARCHDHKFDPVPTADYYALAGIFLSTEIKSGPKEERPPVWRKERPFDDTALPLGPVERIEEARKLGAQHQKLATQLEELEKKLKEAEKRKKPEAAKLKREVEALKKKVEAAKGRVPELEYAFGLTEAQEIGPTTIRIRGEWDKHGDSVPRGLLAAFPHSGSAEFAIPEDQSGRLELARWIASEKNPLTARVAVNRVWQHVFGRGLVSTPDNFGATGAKPTHPELLDWLAWRFIHEHDWSVKSLIRELVLSETFRQSSAHTETGYAADPDNDLLWRSRPRRMEAEVMRDTLLALSGELNRSPLQGSAAAELDRPYTMVDPGDVKKIHDSEQRRHRSVYLAALRGQPTDDLLSVFDFPDPAMVVGRREITTVPSQSLYLMNSESVMECAEKLAERMPDQGRVRWLYRSVLSREPKAEEIERANDFLNRQGRDNTDSWTAFAHSLILSTEFRYIY